MVEVENGAAILQAVGFQVIAWSCAGLCVRRAAVETSRDTVLGAWRVSDRSDNILVFVLMRERNRDGCCCNVLYVRKSEVAASKHEMASDVPRSVRAAQKLPRLTNMCTTLLKSIVHTHLLPIPRNSTTTSR